MVRDVENLFRKSHSDTPLDTILYLNILILDKGGSMNIYVGNLSRDVSDSDIQKAFEAFGKVASVNIIKDKFSGESRGFGFVDMPSKDEAQAAITGMSGKEFMGRALNVNEARPRTDRSDRGGGGRGGGGRRSW
jgi:RNA recognition motif-containing protein